MLYSRLMVSSAVRARDLDISAGKRPLLIQVVTKVLVHQGRAARALRQGIRHRVQRPVIDSDRSGKVFGFGACRRDTGCDRFTDIPHLVGGKRWPEW